MQTPVGFRCFLQLRTRGTLSSALFLPHPQPSQSVVIVILLSSQIYFQLSPMGDSVR